MKIPIFESFIKAILPLFVIFLVGCAPVLSERSLHDADLNVSFQEILNNPNAYKGKVVIVGGRIISTIKKGEETWIEVLQQPLDRQYMPLISDVSYGRFLMISHGVTDPVTYPPGRRITIAGEVMGQMVMPIQERLYAYPVILPREHVLTVSDY